MCSMNGSWRGRKPGGGGDRHRGAEVSSPQDLIVQEDWLSSPLPGSACLMRWTGAVRSGTSRRAASLRRYLRPWRRLAGLAAGLAVAAAAALVPAMQVTTPPARAAALSENTISTEARLQPAGSHGRLRGAARAAPRKRHSRHRAGRYQRIVHGPAGAAGRWHGTDRPASVL